MTTIAYKYGVVAFDSRTTDGDDTIATDDCIKMHKWGGRVFFISGSVPHETKFIESWPEPEKGSGLNLNAFVWDGSQLWYCGSNKDGIWECPVDHPRAIGSGSDHALTAMDMGATAKEAVKMAMKRDPFTGGKIRTFKIPLTQTDR
jgi:hypothetical protein